MEKLEIEFRYTDSNKNRDDYIIRNRFVTIGLFDTIEEAVIKGNETLKLLSDKEQLKTMSKTSRKKALLLRWECVSEQLVNFYNSL